MPSFPLFPQVVINLCIHTFSYGLFQNIITHSGCSIRLPLLEGTAWTQIYCTNFSLSIALLSHSLPPTCCIYSTCVHQIQQQKLLQFCQLELNYCTTSTKRGLKKERWDQCAPRCLWRWVEGEGTLEEVTASIYSCRSCYISPARTKEDTSGQLRTYRSKTLMLLLHFLHSTFLLSPFVSSSYWPVSLPTKLCFLLFIFPSVSHTAQTECVLRPQWILNLFFNSMQFIAILGHELSSLNCLTKSSFG